MHVFSAPIWRDLSKFICDLHIAKIYGHGTVDYFLLLIVGINHHSHLKHRLQKGDKRCNIAR